MSQSMQWKQRAARIAMAASVLATIVIPPAWAAGASLSGPSIAAAKSQVAMTAQALPPGAAVTLAVTSPSGGEAHFSHVAAADGSLNVVVGAAESGKYRVRLLDSSGRRLATAMFIAQ